MGSWHFESIAVPALGTSLYKILLWCRYSQNKKNTVFQEMLFGKIFFAQPNQENVQISCDAFSGVASDHYDVIATRVQYTKKLGHYFVLNLTYYEGARILFNIVKEAFLKVSEVLVG